jgi:hypothetical protein
VPLDVRAAAEELLEHLRGWQRKAPDSFDLAPVVARAEEVADLADLLQERLDSDAETMETDRARRINELFKRAVSAMVRLNYTQSDPFDHDSALSQPPVPLLAPVDRLLDAKTGSDAENEILTLLVRRRNRVLYELAEARHALRDSIDMLADGGSY